MGQILRDREELYARLARDHALTDGTGEVEFNECELCGHVEWVCTHSNDGPLEWFITRMSHSLCVECMTIAGDYPGLVFWLKTVLEMRDLKDERRDEEFLSHRHSGGLR